MDFLTVSKAEKRKAGLIIGGVVIGILSLFWFCGSAHAASFEVRGGYRDGVVGAVGFDVPVKKVNLGAVLEVGEDNSASLAARLTKAWAYKAVRPYVGVGVGVAREEFTEVLTTRPGCRKSRPVQYEVTDEEDGLVVEGILGVRYAIKPCVQWLLEVSAQDREHQDSVGVAIGFRFRR